MIYCYPKLSERDALYFRLGGPGLGNLLFPWARAKLFARQYGYQFVAPTWPQLKVGPLLRGELDSRGYFSVFKAGPEEVSGLRRLWILLVRKRVPEKASVRAVSGDVVVISRSTDNFSGLLGHSVFLRHELMAILVTNRVPKLMQSCGSIYSIAVHVRYGDFLAVDPQVCNDYGGNRRLPIEWYVAAVSAVRAHFGEGTPVNVFSDARDEELSVLTELPGVRRILGNNAVEDMLLIAGHRVLIASGSTFSMWASFLGQVPTVWFPGQMKFRLHHDDASEIEYEPGDNLSIFCQRIVKIGR